MSRLVASSALVFAFFGFANLVHARPPIHYQVFLDGPSESPPNASPGTGYGLVDVDTTTHLWHLHVDFSGLLGTTSASHIHDPTAVPFAGTASVATTSPTFTGFPSGVTAGTYDTTYDMSLSSSYNAPFLAGNGGSTASAELALAAGIAGGNAYWNIHTSVVPGGEIRGFIIPLPEPGSALLFSAGAMLALRRRRSSLVAPHS